MAMTSLCPECGEPASVSPRAPEIANLCTWENDEEGIWHPLCDRDGKNQFCFTDDGPEGNGFKFCPFCGRPMVEVKPQA